MGKSKVLVIDDDPAITQQLYWMLCDELEVLTANNLSSAIRRATIYEPDLTIVELRLPPTLDSPDTGLRILAHIKSHLPRSKVFVLCRQNGDETRRMCLNAGADPYVRKPTDLSYLLEALKGNPANNA